MAEVELHALRPGDASTTAEEWARYFPVAELGLSTRLRNCLRRDGIRTVADLASRSEQDLLDIRNFGAVSLHELRSALAVCGVKLADADEPAEPDPGALSYGERRRMLDAARPLTVLMTRADGAQVAAVQWSALLEALGMKP